MATKFSYDPVAVGMKISAMESQPAECGGDPAPVDSSRMSRDGRGDPSNRRYPGYVRLAILVGGALACWAVIGGVAALVF